jgi:hypothetical protein
MNEREQFFQDLRPFLADPHMEIQYDRLLALKSGGGLLLRRNSCRFEPAGTEKTKECQHDIAFYSLMVRYQVIDKPKKFVYMGGTPEFCAIQSAICDYHGFKSSFFNSVLFRDNNAEATYQRTLGELRRLNITPAHQLPQNTPVAVVQPKKSKLVLALQWSVILSFGVVVAHGVYSMVHPNNNNGQYQNTYPSR